MQSPWVVDRFALKMVCLFFFQFIMAQNDYDIAFCSYKENEERNIVCVYANNKLLIIVIVSLWLKLYGVSPMLGSILAAHIDGKDVLQWHI